MGPGCGSEPGCSMQVGKASGMRGPGPAPTSMEVLDIPAKSCFEPPGQGHLLLGCSGCGCRQWKGRGSPTSVPRGTGQTKKKKTLGPWTFPGRVEPFQVKFWGGGPPPPSPCSPPPKAESRRPAQPKPTGAEALTPKEARKHPLEKKKIFIIPMMGITTRLQQEGSSGRSWDL